MLPCSNGLIPNFAPMHILQTTIRSFALLSQNLDSQGELFPLQSPLLGESWLVSFPPLNNMLKFGGSSYLIWDPIVIVNRRSVCSFVPRNERAQGAVKQPIEITAGQQITLVCTLCIWIVVWTTLPNYKPVNCVWCIKLAKPISISGD